VKCERCRNPEPFSVREFSSLPSSHHYAGLRCAGSGKTTTLAVIREGVESEGYRVEGFAPTSRAANKLAEAGIETSTLQHHLA